ncbi:MAG TPA: endonuclease/exonuclease/phosphatase family protein [Polyangia bacterium]|nr:endonuclease/exonuclease/phosphatase family protein [Polyangia bacterium]
MRARRTLGLAALAALATTCAHPPTVHEPPVPPVAATGPAFRLLTYNVNFGIPGDAATVAAIRDADADLVLLQETNAAWEQALRKALSPTFPAMLFKNRAAAAGFAVLSRLPIVESELIPPSGDGWFPALRIVVETPFGRVQALSVHLRPPVSESGSAFGLLLPTEAVRVAEIRGFVARLSPDVPTLVAGDFNEEEDGDAVRVLRERGMRSALARHAPGQPTWRWKTVFGTLHRQLDHVFYDARLDVAWAAVRVAGRSDHLPVIAVVTSVTPTNRPR